MLIAYLGNFVPAHSTEQEVRRALEILGHEVLPIQEGTPAVEVYGLATRDRRPDVFLWTRTGDLAAKSGTTDQQLLMLAGFANEGIPTVGYHLDRWWGLNREGQVYDEAFFRCDFVCTADGGHDEEWAQAGVNHRWLPPAISELEAVPGRRREGMASPIAFVGSWRFVDDDEGNQVAGYHPEWGHRRQLVEWLRTTYGDRVRFWPQEQAIRGRALADIYASTDVVVGDSCLVGDSGRYWSDRIPETLGRRGFLLHPEVDGLADQFLIPVHLDTWPAGDWDQLGALVEYYLERPALRIETAEAGWRHVRLHHTYSVRMRRLLAMLAEEGAL